MKLSDRRVRIAVLIFVIAGAEAIGSTGAFGTLAVFAEITAFLWLVWTLFAMLRDRKRKSTFSIGDVIYKAVMRVLSPALKRIRRKNDRRCHFVKGTDKVEYVRSAKQKGRLHRVKKRKICIDSEEENTEKVRLSYVKYVLSAAERGTGITYADTPFEIKDKDGKEGTERLFELYSEVRYGDRPAVSDADAKLCKTIADGETP